MPEKRDRFFRFESVRNAGDRGALAAGPSKVDRDDFAAGTGGQGGHERGGDDPQQPARKIARIS